MCLTSDGLLGEGGFSIVRRGLDLQTGMQVAIKEYKIGCSSVGELATKFKCQVEVLQHLQKPWSLECKHARLATQQPSDLFVRLLGFSQNSMGEPGPDASDGTMYLVTELADCSLKDYFRQQRKHGAPLAKEKVRDLVHAILLATAGLHAKGYVHLDLKPENLMIFNGQLKLIDMDGCLEIGTQISDSSQLACSPCYIAPEWARFLLSGDDSGAILVANPGLDAWSAGLTLCECVTLGTAMRPAFLGFAKVATSPEEAQGRFLQWLGEGLDCPPVPACIKEFDPELYTLLAEGLLVHDPAARPSPMQCLSHPYLRQSHEKL